MENMFPQLILNGIALGSAYALIALGFVLVINAVGAVNFAQGDLVMAGGFIAVILSENLSSHIGNVFAGLIILPVTILAMGVLGLLFSLCAYLPLRQRPPVSVFISTIAIGLILQHGANAGFGPEPRIGPLLIDGSSISIGSIVVSVQQISIICAAIILVGLIWFLLHRTQLGRQLRAAAQNSEMAQAFGINSTKCIMITFALGVALAGAAGTLLSNQFLVTPNDGGMFMLKAYIAVTIGGWGRLDGAALAALAIGIFEVLVATFVSYVMAEALIYIGLLATLLFRPKGLFPEAIQRRT